MTEIKRITIGLQRPRGNFPGHVAIGHYKVEGDEVVLVDEKGTPVDRHKLARKLKEGDEPRIIAGLLMRSRHSHVSADFNRHLQYPKLRY